MFSDSSSHDCHQALAAHQCRPGGIAIAASETSRLSVRVMDAFVAVVTESSSHHQECRGAATRNGSAMGNVLVAVWREHRILLWLAFGYIAIGGLVLTALGRRWPMRVTDPTFALAWAVMSAVWLGWQYPRSPRRLRLALSGPRLAGATLVTAVVVPTQITFVALKQSIGAVSGFHADPLLIALTCCFMAGWPGHGSSHC